MIELRIHYVTNLQVGSRVRCGIPNWKNVTAVPREVTCERCKQLMAGDMK